MKLLLCSDFKNIGYRYLYKFFNLNYKHNCLFIGYASEDFETEDLSSGSSYQKLESLNCNVIELNENYDFNDKIDLIFVRGGNTTKLIYLLKKFNQFDAIKNLVRQGALYIGESAGSVLAGNDTEWTLRTEPFEIDLKNIYGKDALNGYNFINKMIFVHCSKYRFPFTDEIEGNPIIRVKNKEFYSDYLQDIKIYPQNTYITLGNNQVFYQNGNDGKILTYNWSKIPVKLD